VRENIAVIPYSPLAGGFLTGKYRDLDRLPRSQRARQVKDRHLTEEKLAVVAALDAVARTREMAVAAVAVAWLLTRPAVVAPIIGANSPGQLADLLPAVDLQLDPDEIATLDAVSAGF
jgi:aryl-alcohol dehydrogenase-like predicted oxidoreductase